MVDSRYNLSNFIVGADKSFIKANIKKLRELATGVYVVPPKQSYRLDLISYTLYGTVALKWVLIYVNNIVDMSVVEHGFKISYPTIKDLLKVMNEVSEYIK